MNDTAAQESAAFNWGGFFADSIETHHHKRFLLAPTPILSTEPPSTIALQIINREWEYGRKRGFRCVFERGVLSLYFNFKSLWYRK